MMSIKYNYHIALQTAYFALLVPMLLSASLILIDIKLNLLRYEPLGHVRDNTQIILRSQKPDLKILINKTQELHAENVLSLKVGIASIATQANITSPSSSPKEKGVWVWESPYQMTATRMAFLVQAVSENSFNVIYLSMDDHLSIDVLSEGEDKDTKMKAYADAVERFVALAHAKNISVDAVSGASDWAKPSLRYQPHRLFRFAKSYNVTHENKIRGIQFDIEPYLLPEYKENKEAVLTDYVSFVDEMATMAEDSGLKLTFVIPHFFDRQAAQTPQVTFARHSEYVFTHMLQSLSRLEGSKIIVMAYRDTVEGANGAIALASGEVAEASKMNTGDTKIVIAEETGNVTPEYVTYFHTSQGYLTFELDKIDNSFRSSRAYGGIAINHIIPFLLLPK